MKMNLRVTYSSGKTEEVAASAADLVAFESEFSRSVAKFEVEFRYTDICWLSWHSLNRRKKIAKTFDEWIVDVDSVELGNETNEILPLETPAQVG
jgi:predicted 2-oxoglutarate/Fe(II)-dependent dioxygenase YbiX